MSGPVGPVRHGDHMNPLAARIEWRVELKPGPHDTWQAGTLLAVDEDHARILAKGRHYSRITKVATWETTEDIT